MIQLSSLLKSFPLIERWASKAMHFVWELTLGQVIVGVPIIWVMGYLMKIYSMMLNFRIEHEILMTDWACRQDPPVKLHELPTRQKRWW